MLGALKRQRLLVAIVTNGLPDLQRRKLQLLGLGDLVDAVVISGDRGLGKPHPGPFEAALSRLGIPASRALMVGDSFENDVLGAEAAGLRAVWLTAAPGKASRGRASINTLTELPALL